MRAIHHLDLWVQDRATAVPQWTWLFTSCGWEVDVIEETGGSCAGAEASGWSELYAEKYPHAGGDGHTALYLENSEGFEVEVVVEP